VATIARALTWVRAADADPEWAGAPLRTLVTLLDRQPAESTG